MVIRNNFILNLFFSIALLGLLFGCSSEPDRNLATKLLEAKKWPINTTLIPVAGRNDGDLFSINSQSLSTLKVLVEGGYLQRKDYFYKPGEKKYLQSQILVPHPYSIWTPTEKLKPHISKKQDFDNLLSIEVQKGALNAVTGLSKVDESTYIVEYNWKWVPTDVGEFAAKHGREFGQNNPELKSARAVMKKFDDGWRLSGN